MLDIPIYIYSVCLFCGSLLVAVYLFKANNGFAKTLILPSIVILLSGLSLIQLFHLDSLVHGQLYNYGLQFSEVWANTYWLLHRSLMGFNAVVIGIALGMVVKERIPSRVHKSPKESPSTPTVQEEPEEVIEAEIVESKIAEVKETYGEAPQQSMEDILAEEKKGEGEHESTAKSRKNKRTN